MTYSGKRARYVAKIKDSILDWRKSTQYNKDEQYIDQTERGPYYREILKPWRRIAPRLFIM